MRFLIPALALLIFTAACAGPDSTAKPSATFPPSPAPTAPVAASTSPSPEPAATGSPARSDLEEAFVTRVVDGDTIDVLVDGQEHRVRYIGIDTPETVDPRRTVECFGREASARNRELVEGKTVGLERDVSETDRFGRLLRYVWADGEMVNATLVEEGFATASAFPPDVRYAELFTALEAEAREEGRGLWGPVCATPQPSATAGAGVCDYSGTEEPLIKGNVSHSTGEKIYHVPGGDFYEETVVDEARGERWFCREEEAVAAGWRRSRR